MTYYLRKFDKQRKRYESNTETCAKNNICSLFYLYICHTYPKIMKLVLLEIRINQLSMNKKNSLKTVKREGYDQNELRCLQPT